MIFASGVGPKMDPVPARSVPPSDQVTSVEAAATGITNSCSATAAALFVEAELQAALGL